MHKKNKSDDLKEGCIIINKLFKRKSFFEQLCDFSNNDINLTIENIGKIINYYLVTQDKNTKYDLKTLFEKINEITFFRHDYLIYPTNSYYQNIIRVNGLNGSLSLSKYLYYDMGRLDYWLSFYPKIIPDYFIYIYEELTEAINKSFVSPSSLYESILKQPNNQELPMIVGEEEKTYYYSILEKRLKNVEESMQKTCANIGKRLFNDLIGKDALLVIFPKQFGKTDISQRDISNKETSLRIPPYVLSFITIPSRYKLLSICTKNKKIKNGEPVSIIDGTPYTEEEKSDNDQDVYVYSRLEPVSITEEFIYSNSEFTQDIDYDIDLIYGLYDYNKRRTEITRDFYKDICEIRKKADIMVRLRNGKYEISNGRHRILYIKHYYVTNYELFKSVNQLGKLKQLVTIPMHVERTIENKNVNIFLTKLNKLNNTTRYYKVNINDDSPELLIIFNSKIYFVKTEHELITLYNYLNNNELNNEFFVCNTRDNSKSQTKEIINYLLLTLKEKLYDMNFYEIIKYLLEKGYYIEGQYYKESSVDACALYSCYLEIQGTLQLNKYFNYNKDLIKAAEDHQKIEQIGKIISQLLAEDPSLIELELDELCEVLKMHDALKEYDKDILKEAADKFGYSKMNLESLYNAKKKHKKNENTTKI